MISSPLVIRDPTFWFLLTLTLYLAWRAVLELKPWLFAAAGVALALAIHTRIEGLFLLAPLALWAVFRWPAVRGHRLRLALGGLLCLAMIPGWVLLMNATLLRGHPRVLIHSIHFPGVILGDESPDASARAVSAAGHSTSEPASRESQAAQPKEISPAGGRVAGPPLAHPSLPPPLSLPRTLVKFADRLVKATTYAYGFLMLLGLALWPRVFFRRDQQAMLLFGVLLWLAIAMRMRVGVDIRYYLPGVIASTGYAGLGLLWIAKWICRLTAARLDWTGPRRAALCCALVAVVFALGCRDRRLAERWFMVQHADLGKWILDRFGPHQRLAGAPARNAIGRLLLPGRHRAELLALHLRGRRPGLYDPGLQAGRVDVVERSAAAAVAGRVAEAVGLAAGVGPLPRPARRVAAKLFASPTVRPKRPIRWSSPSARSCFTPPRTRARPRGRRPATRRSWRSSVKRVAKRRDASPIRRRRAGSVHFSKRANNSQSSPGSAKTKPSTPSLSSSLAPFWTLVALGSPQAAASITLKAHGS